MTAGPSACDLGGVALDESTSRLAHRLHFWARNACNQSAVLLTSDAIGLLSLLRQGVTVEEAARRLSAVPRGIRSLVEILIALGHVTVEGGSRLSSPLDTALADPAVRAALGRAREGWSALGALDQEVRGTGPTPGLDQLRWALALPVGADPQGTLLQQAVVDAAFTAALLAAGRLGLLEALAKGPHPPDRLLPGTDAERLAPILSALERMELAAGGEQGWALAPAARGVLDEKNLPYFVRSLPVTAEYWEPLRRLDEAVLRGQFLLDLKDPETCARFYAENARQITAVFASHFQLARKAALTVARHRPLAGLEVLDIGTGSGVWGAAFAHADPSCKVTYFDQPAVLEHTRLNLRRLKLEERAQLLPGNCVEADFGEARWDVVILPQVLNVLWPQTLPGLFARVARALRPDGLLLIAEYVLHDKRDGPLDYLYFGLRRYMTNEGDLLSLREYADLLRPVGLKATRLFPLSAQELVVASRDEALLPTALG